MNSTRANLILIGLALYTLVAPLVGAAFLLAVLDPAQSWLSTLNIWQAQAAMLVIGTVAITLALLPSMAFGAFVGFVSGGHLGAYLTVTLAIGIATGLAIALAARLSHSATEVLLTRSPKTRVLYERLKSNSGKDLSILLVMARLSPHVPFAFTNLAVAQLPISIVRATFLSWLGLLPRSLVAVGVGAGLSQLSDLSDLSIDGQYGVIATVALFIAVGIYLRRLGRRHTGNGSLEQRHEG